MIDFIRDNKMSATITTTSQTVEAMVVRNGVAIETKYFDTENQALDFVAKYHPQTIEFETLDI